MVTEKIPKHKNKTETIKPIHHARLGFASTGRQISSVT
jgi:hypothetical protein